MHLDISALSHSQKTCTIDNNIPFGINSLIYQEVLQGVKSEKDFIKVKKYLDTQRFYELKDKRESYAAAAKIYFLGYLIVQTAIEKNLYLLHNDSDFERISKVVQLKIFNL